jgi:hypothetical protein
MSEHTPRILSTSDLGRAGAARDVALGLAALLPILACVAIAYLFPAAPSMIPRTLAVMWSACLLAFFAGVRRGLTFSEVGGARRTELVSMLVLFGLGVTSMLFCNAAVAALGLVCVGAFDALAARRGEAPRYFTAFRPIQMALGAGAMLLIQIRAG